MESTDCSIVACLKCIKLWSYICSINDSTVKGVISIPEKNKKYCKVPKHIIMLRYQFLIYLNETVLLAKLSLASMQKIYTKEKQA